MTKLHLKKSKIIKTLQKSQQLLIKTTKKFCGVQESSLGPWGWQELGIFFNF